VTAPSSSLVAPLRDDGFVFVDGDRFRRALSAAGSLDDWPAFSSSWGDLRVDEYMADHGRYRRRRHSTFAVDSASGITLRPHQPHFQALDYNPLNGGIERWFEPVRPEVASGPSLQTILRLCASLFGAASPGVRSWHVEVHQFRIEARKDAPGLPTPEGVHRDGVDHVLVMMVERTNISSGTTTIHRPSGELLGSFTLSDPFDAALLDDHRVFHGVTAVEPADPSRPAHRDVLVVTFRRQ
jgi:hypothetical protein